jgi:hypothetical protein
VNGYFTGTAIFDQARALSADRIALLGRGGAGCREREALTKLRRDLRAPRGLLQIGG